MPVRIGGSSYIPPLPIELVVKEAIDRIVSSGMNAIDIAIGLALFVTKTQIFNAGNKRTAVIFANHYLIAHGGGILVILESNVPEFKKLLLDYYEDKDSVSIKQFLRETCWMKFQ